MESRTDLRQSEIVFVDGGLEQLETLLEGVRPGVAIRILEHDEAPLEVLAAEGHQARAVHVLAHGRAGHIALGSGCAATTMVEALGGTEAEELWLYACEVAAERGLREALAASATRHGLGLAAASGKVGSATGGGSWDLDLQVGTLVAGLAIEAEARAAYPGVLVEKDGTEASEILDGTASNDLINGFGGDDLLRGFAGNDTLIGGDGSDRFIGGAGNDLIVGGFLIPSETDIVDYSDATGAMTVNLATERASGGGQGADTIIGIEWIVAGNYADKLVGDAADNYFQGGGGNDTINGGDGFDIAIYTDATGVLTVNLAAGTATASGSGSDTLTSIEGIMGSNFSDTLTGDDNDNYFRGNAGDDTINGGGGTDSADYRSAGSAVIVNLVNGKATGGGGTDTLISIESAYGSSFDDLLVGDAGNNTLRGRGGNDTLQGGAGIDRADYKFANAGVSVDLAAGTSSGADGNDSLVSIENVRGGYYADQLSGDGGANVLQGLWGSDWLKGRGGADILDGDVGSDTLQGGVGNDTLIGGDSNDFDYADYRDATGAVTVSLASGSGSGGGRGADVLIGIEGAMGGNYADRLTGDGGENYFRGGKGNDTINGGDGFDGAEYYDATGAITVNLTTGKASGGGLGTDTLISIEGVYGSNFNDKLIGSAAKEVFRGGLGIDTIDGGGGTDVVDYRSASAAVSVNLVTRVVTGPDGADVISNIEGAYGSRYNDTLIGDGGDNLLRGREGNDTLNGGNGRDRADYRFASGDVTVNLASGKSSGADGVDTLISIEDARGSTHNDLLIGTGAANTLQGLAGDDTLRGAGGADLLIGDEGNDRLEGGAGNDSVYGGDGADYLLGGDGNDELAGGTGLDTVDGGNGNDTMIYTGATVALQITLAASGDTVVDFGGGFTEILRNIENLGGGSLGDMLAGNAGNNRLSGLEGNDTLRGNGGADFLDGGAGNDSMVGGAGNDTYVVDSGSDKVVEFSGGGFDTVRSFVSHTLKANVEKLVLLGTGNLNGTGNGLGNTLQGNAGNNLLNGGGGNDTLLGGNGADTLVGGAGQDKLTGGGGGDAFRFANGPLGSGNVDTLTDFVSGIDRLQLDDDVFTAFGQSSSARKIAVGNFVLGTSAADANDYLIYDRPSGALYYDADGNGGGAKVQVAQLGSGTGHPALVAGDIWLIA